MDKLTELKAAVFDVLMQMDALNKEYKKVTEDFTERMKPIEEERKRLVLEIKELQKQPELKLVEDPPKE